MTCRYCKDSGGMYVGLGVAQKPEPCRECAPKPPCMKHSINYQTMTCCECGLALEAICEGKPTLLSEARLALAAAKAVRGGLDPVPFLERKHETIPADWREQGAAKPPAEQQGWRRDEHGGWIGPRVESTVPRSALSPSWDVERRTWLIGGLRFSNEFIAEMAGRPGIDSQDPVGRVLAHCVGNPGVCQTHMLPLEHCLADCVRRQATLFPRAWKVRL